MPIEILGLPEILIWQPEIATRSLLVSAILTPEMHHTIAQYAMWLICTIALLVILVAMVKRNLVSEYQIFFWYIAAHALESVVSFIANQVSYAAYFYVFWGWEAIDAIFTLVVIQYVFVKVFDGYDAIHGLGLTLFRWVTVVLCIFSVVSAIYAPSVQPYGRLMAGILVLQRSNELIQVGLLLCLFFCSRLFGLPWRHYIYGITLGFGVNATLGLVAAAIWAHSTFAVRSALAWMSGASFTLAVFTWTYYMLSTKAVEASVKPPSSEQLEAWNDALAGILRR